MCDNQQLVASDIGTDASKLIFLFLISWHSSKPMSNRMALTVGLLAAAAATATSEAVARAAAADTEAAAAAATASF